MGFREFLSGETRKSWCAAWQAQYPQLIKDTLEADPRFVDGDKRDFRLKNVSPCIDAGAFLTRAAGAGQGTELRVEDAGWFCDGVGIEGLAGDEIQLEGAARPVRALLPRFPPGRDQASSGLASR